MSMALCQCETSNKMHKSKVQRSILGRTSDVVWDLSVIEFALLSCKNEFSQLL